MKAYGSKSLVKEGKIYFKATKCNPFNRVQAKVVPCPCANVRFSHIMQPQKSYVVEMERGERKVIMAMKTS